MDQWLDFSTSLVSGAGLEAACAVVNDFLALRTFLVGHGVTLADVAVWGQLAATLQWGRLRKAGKLPHLARWFDTLAAVPELAAVTERHGPQGRKQAAAAGGAGGGKAAAAGAGEELAAAKGGGGGCWVLLLLLPPPACCAAACSCSSSSSSSCLHAQGWLRQSISHVGCSGSHLATAQGMRKRDKTAGGCRLPRTRPPACLLLLLTRRHRQL